MVYISSSDLCVSFLGRFFFHFFWNSSERTGFVWACPIQNLLTKGREVNDTFFVLFNLSHICHFYRFSLIIRCNVVVVVVMVALCLLFAHFAHNFQITVRHTKEQTTRMRYAPIENCFSHFVLHVEHFVNAKHKFIHPNHHITFLMSFKAKPTYFYAQLWYISHTF